MHTLRVSLSIWFYSSLFSCVALMSCLSFVIDDVFILSIVTTIGLSFFIPLHLFMIFVLKEIRITWETQIWLMSLCGWLMQTAIIFSIINLSNIETNAFLKWMFALFAIGGSCSLGAYVACIRNHPSVSEKIHPIAS